MTLLSHFFKVRHFILAAALTTGLGFVNHANALTQAAFLIDLNSRTAIDLGTLGGWSSFAYGINDAGQVVGGSLTADGNHYAFITGPDGVGMRNLGTLGGSWSVAHGINDAGQVVGYFSASGKDYPFITGPDGMGVRDLGTLSRRAYGINDAGQVVGESFITGPDGMGMRGLGSLGGGGSVAFDINNVGQMVGDSYTAAGQPHAFITSLNGVGMRDLGTLGGSRSFAHGINDAGQVVGESATADVNRHAFITGPGGEGMMDLNSLVDLPDGVILFTAMDINNRGQVIANAIIIPEPEAYALMLAGLGLVGFMARRKKMENLKRY
jgi:probable HAF family extracellular repeat protein